MLYAELYDFLGILKDVLDKGVHDRMKLLGPYGVEFQKGSASIVDGIYYIKDFISLQWLSPDKKVLC